LDKPSYTVEYNTHSDYQHKYRKHGKGSDRVELASW